MSLSWPATQRSGWPSCCARKAGVNLRIRRGRPPPPPPPSQGYVLPVKRLNLTYSLFFFPGVIAAYRYRFAYYNIAQPYLSVLKIGQIAEDFVREQPKA